MLAKPCLWSDAVQEFAVLATVLQLLLKLVQLAAQGPQARIQSLDLQQLQAEQSIKVPASQNGDRLATGQGLALQMEAW